MDCSSLTSATSHAQNELDTLTSQQIVGEFAVIGGGSGSGGGVVVEEQPKMWGLSVQPLEVLHHIFTHVKLEDVVALSSTCRHIRDCITHDDLLWREQYCKLFNTPVKQPENWKDALKELRLLKKFLQNDDRAEKEERLEDVGDKIINLTTRTHDTNPSLNQTFLAELMATRSNRSCFLSRSSLFHRAGHPLDVPADTEALRQLSAKLHVYYGTDMELNELDLEADGSRQIHLYARARVYDLRRYTTKNEWGPLMDDGSGKVDWEKIQAIVTVLACGIPMLSHRFSRLVTPFWGRPFHGLAANSFTGNLFESAMVQEDRGELTDRDPYNISGTWVRMVNFLDYHDLFAYNFQAPELADDQERDPISTKEAIRLIWMQLRVTEIENAHDGDDPNMPRVHFKGDSKSLTNSWDPNANSSISGYVRTTIHGDIRWTTFSVVYGEERWRSECVQIGGPNSARGTAGNWFDKNYDPHGPAGPTAFWKISNGFLSSRDSHVGLGLMSYQHLHLDEIYDDENDMSSSVGEDEDGDDSEEEEQENNSDNDHDRHGNQGTDTVDTITLHPGEVQGLPPRTEVTITVTDGVITSVETREV